jgi:hypothetical protein
MLFYYRVMTYEQLTAAAEAEARSLRTITREDGSSFQTVKGYGSASHGRFQVYVVPVEQRTRRMQAHYRFTFYVQDFSGKFRRTTEAAFRAALELAG